MYDLGKQFHIDLNNLQMKNAQIVQGNRFRISILTDRLIRLEYNKNGQFNDLATALVMCRIFDKPECNIREDNNFLEIVTKYFKLEYSKEMPFKGTSVNPIKNLKITLNGTQQYWYYGHPEVRNYYGSNNCLGCNQEGNRNKGLYSLDGFVSFDDSNTLRLDTFGTINSPNPESVDIYIFMYGKDFGLAMQDYFKLTGMPSFLPRYALGNWWCREKTYSQENILDLSNKFDFEGVPISIILLDKDWHKRDVYNNKLTNTGFSFNNNLFPNPSEMINELHKKNIKIGLSIDPIEGIYPFENYYAQVCGYLGMNAGTIIRFDPLNPRFLDVYFKVLIQSLESLGIDFFWNDYNNVNDLNVLWILNHYHYLDSGKHDTKRSMLMSRNSLIAAHRYSILYSGKTNVSWDNFKLIPFYNLSSSNIGVCWWSHDIAGFSGGIEESELYIRSVQLGTFSPILRFHSAGGKYYKRAPWVWDKKTCEITSEFLKLRHKLIPYLYTEAYKYSSNGTIVFQPLYYLIPKIYDDLLYRNEYFYGSELLIAPITTRKDPTMNRTIHRFYLPEGIWYDFLTGKKFIGNKKYVAFYKEEDYPVFARRGAIIPLSMKSNFNNTGNPTDLEIHVFPGANNTYELYEDDGVSHDYKAGAFFKTIIDYNYLPNNHTLIIRNNPESRNSLVPNLRNYKIRFRNTKQPEEVICRLDNNIAPFNGYIENNDFIVEVNNVDVLRQLTVNCKGIDIEIDAVRLVNEDIDDILSDLQIETVLKEKISDAIFSNDTVREKRIALRKLKRDGLDKSFIKLFLNLLEYIEQI